MKQQPLHPSLIAYSIFKQKNILLNSFSTQDEQLLLDFENEQSLTKDDLKKITAKIKETISQNIPIEYITIELESLKKLQEQRKISKNVDISKFDKNQIPLLKIDDFYMISEKLNFEKTGEFCQNGFQLNSISAINIGRDQSYSAQRLFAFAFNSKENLEKHLDMLTLVQQRDHRKIAQEMDLFFMSENGSGLAMLQPNGAIIRRTIENFEHYEHAKRGYKPVYTPHVYNANVWKKSGHYECYKDHMFLFKENNEEYGVKPMSCPGHVEIFKKNAHSYRDLPIRYFELATVYRRENSGSLQGLLRVTNITQDDAHIFCTQKQLKSEIVGVLDFVKYMMDTFGLNAEYEISTKPEKFIGNEETWNYAETILKESLPMAGIKNFSIDQGGGAFYGPKIDVKMKDALGRKWQGPTVQLDFNFPERFNMEYVNEEGKKERPIMLHRVVLGSMERFLGILIEHYNGKFPLWLAPEQCAVLTVNDSNKELSEYQEKIASRLLEEGFRIETNSIRGNSLGSKISNVRNRRIPYAIVLGQKELQNNTLSVRVRDNNNQYTNISLDNFISLLKTEQQKKMLQSIFISENSLSKGNGSKCLLKQTLPNNIVSKLSGEHVR